MKKFTVSLFSLLLAVNFAFAGGLVTNTNQSTAWARMLVRDASTSVDAAYYNPAGLTKLQDGLYISFSNQSIFQTQTVTNSFPYLNNPVFKGTVSAPVFPDLYVVYKNKRWAFSAGFMIIGGGGISSLVGALGATGVKGCYFRSCFCICRFALCYG